MPDPTILSLLDHVDGLPTSRPSLFLDLEGIKLGRYGSISIISLYVLARDAGSPGTVYLVDVHRLGQTAFLTPNSRLTSLKTILESRAIPKVIFDVRNDSDALFAHYRISVAGIVDLQLMELASRRGSRDFVAGLAKCIGNDVAVSAAAKAEWQRTKDTGSRLFDPNKGGRYEVFNERPLRLQIQRYCAQDVVLLPALHGVYEAKLHVAGQEFWQGMVEDATVARVKSSQSAGYDPHSREKARGPWDARSIQKAREEYIDDDPDDWYQDSARDCDGWEEDMIRNGSPFKCLLRIAPWIPR
ncbi:hypothetical protein LTR36_004645 [Oleoguttula mirabilis]|uniref:3'-5' exonuclease domain-containing protein n=1 Tax=Oleoguttula mirabilis TaxID=1507867 RepID=A0AAV9JH44_9PEZI|nr:hypothetical protein LTR36_004645 [Oleoguttula mirabilis]